MASYNPTSFFSNEPSALLAIIILLYY